MAIRETLECLKSDRDLGPNFVAWRHLPSTDPCLVPFPEALDSRLADSLARRGIEALYSHQAVDARRRHDVRGAQDRRELTISCAVARDRPQTAAPSSRSA